MKISRTHIGRISKLTALAACLGAIGFMGIVLVPQISLGASTNPFIPSNYPNIQGCPINSRFDNWGRFIKDGASFSDFYSNWGDIFTRNSCQQQDIFAIQKTIEGIQNQLRQKIFQCQSGGLSELSTKIHELQFELEYVRHVIDTDDERPAPEGTKGEVRPPAAIVQYMLDSPMLKDGTISSDRFDALFAIVQQKYATRVEQYRNCKDADWAALTKQWNNFTSTWAGIKPATQQSAKSLTNRVNTFLDVPSDHNGRFLGGLLDIKMNGLTPERNLAGVYQDLTRDVRTGAAKNPPDYSVFLDQAESEHDRYSRDAEDAKRKSYYEGLFRYTSDATVEEIVGSDKNMGELKKMNSIIQATIQPVIDNMRACTALIAQRQCGGK